MGDSLALTLANTKSIPAIISILKFRDDFGDILNCGEH